MAAGGGEGVCAAGPASSLCDGVIRANGEGFIQCFTNADCGPAAIGIDAGNCLLSQTRDGFLDPVTAAGVADANRPVAAATFCLPPTGNSGINGVAGLPGPAKVLNQASSRIFCASNPSVLYEPGVGGCP